MISGPEVGKRTCLKHHYCHSLWLHLPKPPPTCLLLLRFMWLYRVGAKSVCQAMWRPSFYTDSCLYDAIVGSKSGFGPVYLRSVISESLKRLRQFREDKWWTGRTADVGTQTLQDDGVDYSRSPNPTMHTVEGYSSAQPLTCCGSYTWVKSLILPKKKFLQSRPSTWATLLLLSKQMIKNGYWVFAMSLV